MKRAETDLAAAVIGWLEAQHWDVYQEVCPGRGEGVCDIVGTQGHLVWCIEAKQTLSLAVLEQAVQWHQSAHFISVAVPESTHRRSAHHCLRAIRDTYGLGMIEIDQYRDVRNEIAPRLNRHARPDRIKACLCPEQKVFAAAGNPDGHYWTAFARTCRALREHLAVHGPSPVKEVVAAIDHHYHTDSTARSCLLQWVRSGVIKGVNVKQEGRTLLLALARRNRTEDHESDATLP